MTSRLVKKLTPLFDRVLISRTAAKKKEIGGILLPDSAQDKANTGKVVAIGNGKRTPDGKVLPLSVKVGDTVLLSEFGGNDIKIEDEEFVVVREEDILGVLKDV
eukprot:TRINITY_DN1354_c0_g1_i5.p1 TRINITY_DN1354_c0_g1~~TRINITY_DN1354_c0_g1_i5.p1  ORF type:complete len:104 (+),score=25.24 TRINITY_DN1354_c0_g1_i5:88-399(+)